MKQHIKRSTALLVCLAMLMSFLGGIPGSFVTKANAAETTGNLKTAFYYDFENDTGYDSLVEAGWTNWGSGSSTFSIEDDAERGGKVAKYTHNQGIPGIHGLYLPMHSVTAGQSYTISMMVKSTVNASIFVYWYDDGNNKMSQNSNKTWSLSNEWSSQSYTVTAPTGATRVQVALYNTVSSTADVYYDDVRIVGNWFTPTNSKNVGSTPAATKKTLIWPSFAAAGGEFEVSSRSELGSYNTGDGLGWYFGHNNAKVETATGWDTKVLSLLGTSAVVGAATPMVVLNGMETVKLSFDIKSTASLSLYIYPFNAEGDVLASKYVGIASTDDSWIKKEVEYTVPDGTAYLRAYLTIAANVGGNVYIDNLDLECVHANGDADHVCDACGATLSQCADTDNDHLCDLCTKPLTECADNDNDHNCDTCGDPVSECADNDNDHNCDTCGDPVSECADNDDDHNCDTCGDPVSECADNNNDHNCDTCDAVLTSCDDYWVAGTYVEPTLEADGYTPYTCSICGATKNVIDKGTQLTAVAKVGEKKYATLAEAVAEADGETIVILENIDLTAAIEVSNITFTLDLAGHTITADWVDPDGVVEVLWAKAGANVTITGNGKMIGGNEECGFPNVISATDGASVIIKNGTFTSGCSVIYATRSGSVAIEDGLFEATADYEGHYYVLDVNEAEAPLGIITVSGGQFVKFDPANHTTDGDYSNKVVEGYHSIGNAGVYTVGAHNYADGYCACGAKDPNATFVAKVGDTEYTTLAEAIANAEANGTVTLTGTINLDAAGVTINKNLTINLNGQTVNSLGDVFVCTAGTLTITGEGDINAGLQDQGDYVAVWANGGTVIIRGGTWSCGGDSRPHAKGHQNDVIYVGKLGGRIEVYAGYFEYTEEVWTLNESDIQRGSLKVYGGTFEQFDPSNSIAQENGDPSFVAEGYTVNENNGVYTVVEMPEAATNTRFGETLSLLVGYVQEELGNPLTQNLVGQLTKADGTVITLENWTKTTDASTGTAYYVLELSGLFADEMTVTFEVVVLDANGNAVTKTEELSIRSYAMNILENSTDSEYKTLIVDMLNYGAEAEKKFAGKSDSDDLANSLLSNEQKALATDVMGTVSNTRDPQDIGGVFQGSNVRFTEEINLLFRLDIELDTYAVFTWKDHNGEDQRVVVENEDYTKSGDYYVVELVGLVVADARQTVTCEIYNNGETTNPVLTISDSIAANVARVTGDYVNLYQAFMKFADSANNYMH